MQVSIVAQKTSAPIFKSSGNSNGILQDKKKRKKILDCSYYFSVNRYFLK